MTTYDLSRLNRDIQILYRHLCGDTTVGMSVDFNLSQETIRRIIRRSKQNPRIIRAAEARKAARIKEFDQEVNV